MRLKEINAKSILRKYKRVDSWFISCYAMNLYRGCLHNCVYCDGRNKKYQITGDFGKDIIVKINAIELMQKELSQYIHKKQLKPCYLMLGGGVGDSYQPIEEKYKLTRKALSLLKKFQIPVSILTKSTLIKRDLDLLKEIKEQSRVLINFSFSSTNDEISMIFEPGVPVPSNRLQTIKKFKKEGFVCGMFILPVIPFITDQKSILKQTIKDAYAIGIDYIIFGGMTLKFGNQKDYFFQILEEYYPNLKGKYETIYKKNKYGNAIPEYYKNLHQLFILLMKEYHIPIRIPPRLYRDILNENDFVSVMLDQLDYLCKIHGKKSYYGYASYQISQLKQPLSTMKNKLRTIRGVGNITEKIIIEILETKTSNYFEKLLY
jgi:DNA repair photolyase